MPTRETGRARGRDPIGTLESLVGIVPPAGAANTQLDAQLASPRAAASLDPVRARWESPCPYCGRLIRVGDPISKTYVRVGWGNGWAYGRCSNLWWLHAHCASDADDRRKREPPLSRTGRDEIKTRALRRYRSGRQYIPPGELPAFEAAAERARVSARLAIPPAAIRSRVASRRS